MGRRDLGERNHITRIHKRIQEVKCSQEDFLVDVSVGMGGKDWEKGEGKMEEAGRKWRG